MSCWTSPRGIYPLYGLCVGVPAETPLARPRLPLESVLLDDAWPSPDEATAAMDAYDGVYAGYQQQRGTSETGWSPLMAEKFAKPARTDLAAYYADKGAILD